MTEGADLWGSTVGPRSSRSLRLGARKDAHVGALPQWVALRATAGRSSSWLGGRHRSVAAPPRRPAVHDVREHDQIVEAASIIVPIAFMAGVATYGRRRRS